MKLQLELAVEVIDDEQVVMRACWRRQALRKLPLELVRGGINGTSCKEVSLGNC